METDDLGHLPSSTLRRSNSAPNVSAAVVSEAIPIFQPLQTARQRRFSTSQMAVNIVSKNSANKCQERIASFWHYFSSSKHLYVLFCYNYFFRDLLRQE